MDEIIEQERIARHECEGRGESRGQPNHPCRPRPELPPPGPPSTGYSPSQRNKTLHDKENNRTQKHRKEKKKSRLSVIAHTGHHDTITLVQNWSNRKLCGVEGAVAPDSAMWQSRFGGQSLAWERQSRFNGTLSLEKGTCSQETSPCEGALCMCSDAEDGP